VHVAVITDKAYLPWCATTVLSCARASHGTPVTIHVLHAPDVADDDRRRLAASIAGVEGAVEFHPVDEEAVAALPSRGPAFGGRTCWMRMLLPDVLPDLARVIYLDADTLTVCAIDELWTLPLADAPVAAVSNVTEPAMHAHVASLGVGEPGAYFNAGVLVVNLARWREEKATEAILDFVARHEGALPWFDQDAMNAVFAHRWKHLHPRWNAMNSLWTWPEYAAGVFGEDIVDDARSRPRVLHFEGPSILKPWHYLCDHPWRSSYRSTLAQTPWAGVSLTERTLATRVIARLPRRRRIPAYKRLDNARSRVMSIRDRLGARP
jgi:lipopolysaccharide biosynthesis glycosyltransferase